MELSLRFEDNDTLEHDLVLRFVGLVQTSNSLYLALDENILPGQEDAEKIRLVLRTLLEQWLAAIEDVAEGGTVYLPCGFWYQSTDWLRCVRSGDALMVCDGWSEIAASSLTPSAIGDYMTQLPDFRIGNRCVHVPLREVREAIRATMI